MTQEQKAKAYDEALKWMCRLYPTMAGIDKEDAEHYFPELRESEDERIRKAIIEEFRVKGIGGREDKFFRNGIKIKDAIDWLEKQGENTLVEEIKRIKEILLKEKEKETSLHTKISLGGRIAMLEELLVFANEKQDEQKPTENFIEIWKDMRLEVYQQVSGNRHEPNYSDDNTKMFSLNDIDEIIEKIAEKQSESKPQGKTAFETIKEEKVDNQNCVKPADKVEPKFHEGAWIVSNKDNTVHQVKTVIENVSNGEYAYDLIDGGYVSTSYESDYHLWTIEDAKDGDVLVSQYGRPFIYKDNRDSILIGSYCGISVDGNFRVATEKCHWTENMNIHPATKEQRDALTKAMTDAGYTFDFEKKELKKIEQKPTDEEMKELLRTEYEKGRADAIAETQVAWSEEDEKRIANILSVLSVQCWDGATGEKMIPYQKEIDWLKSFKPQTQWKPSEKQMEALDYYANSLRTYCDRQDDLRSLYNDLKKLKEE